MSARPGSDATTALNAVLSEVLDLVQDVKQAHRKVPETHALHAELDQLFDDLRAWAPLLFEDDKALGGDPLASMPSVAGRKPPNRWPGAASDADVSRLVADDVDRLRQHVVAALEEQDAEGPRRTLTEIEHSLLEHWQRLNNF